MIGPGSRAPAAALSVALFVAAIAPFVAGLAAADVVGEPELSLTAADNRVSAGEAATLEVAVVNRGSVEEGSDRGNAEAERLVTRARGLTLEAAGSGPVTVRTGEVALGSLEGGESRTAPLEVVVADDADPGTYDIDVEVEYVYTERVEEGDSPSHETERRTLTLTVPVVVDEDARFEVLGVRSQSPGDAGTFAVDVENTGEASANDAVASLTSTSGDLRFGEGEGSGAYVERWEPGERRTLEFSGSVGDDAPLSELPAVLSVEYADDDGVEFASQSTFGIAPDDEQTFAFESVDSTLRVAQDGTVRGTVVNEGPREARNVVATLSPPSENIDVLEPEVALGDLEAGEEADVSFDVEVSSAARSGPRQFTLEADYENARGEDRTADAVRFRETVEPRQDVFSVEVRNGTVERGGSERVVLAVTNNREETVTDVSAKVFASRPLSVDDDEGYVSSLEPGETVEIPFRVSASDAAMAKDYPISVDFQYVDEDGETRLTDSDRLPVTVEASNGGWFGLFDVGVPLAVGTVVVVPLAAAALRARRR